MRYYKNFEEAFNETRRELKEMGHDVKLETYQNLDIKDDPNFFTKELAFYSYMVKNPSTAELEPKLDHADWVHAELKERLSRMPQNDAWKLWPDMWEQFMRDGKFSYTYPERLFSKIDAVIKELKRDPFSRRAYINLWNDRDYMALERGDRVPCTIGYSFLQRDRLLHMEYKMRSCDFASHFIHDVYFAVALQEHIAHKLGLKVGHFIHNINSLHIYAKDVSGVF